MTPQGTESLLQTLVTIYSESCGLDIKVHRNETTDDFTFTLRDERSVNRVAYFRVPHIQAKEMQSDLALFDKSMRGLIVEANKHCDHEQVAENEYFEDSFCYFTCVECGSEMIKAGEYFIVKVPV